MYLFQNVAQDKVLYSASCFQTSLGKSPAASVVRGSEIGSQSCLQGACSPALWPSVFYQLSQKPLLSADYVLPRSSLARPDLYPPEGPFRFRCSSRDSRREHFSSLINRYLKTVLPFWANREENEMGERWWVSEEACRKNTDRAVPCSPNPPSSSAFPTPKNESVYV